MTMVNGKTIAVVVPAFNEGDQIGRVLDTLPEFVDKIVVVDDGSTDHTTPTVRAYLARQDNKSGAPLAAPAPAAVVPTRYNAADRMVKAIRRKERGQFVPSRVVNADPATDRVVLIEHEHNGGVGAAIASGYEWCLRHQIDCVAVMAGDGQMDPLELPDIVGPVVRGEADYVKGNRLIHRSAWLVIPRIRYFGNSILSILTKIASGYWRVSDTQCGYTAISLKALRSIRLHQIYRRYGMPNDVLVKLNIAFCTLKEVEIKPVYRVGETSKMRVWRVMPRIAALLLRSFFKRLWIKYLFRDFHPLFLLYNFSFLLGALMLPYAAKIIRLTWRQQPISFETLLLFVFLATSGFQAMLFAMWMDMQDNERLYK